MMTRCSIERSVVGPQAILYSIVVVAGLLALTATPAPLLAQCPDGTPPPCAGLAPRTAAGPPASSIAVLYFETRDTADTYLADGLTEEIATSLGRVARLHIKSPSAVRRAQRQAAGNLRAIGRMLNVFWVVEGSVRRGAGRMRVSVRLVNAANETATWSDAFSRPASDVLGLEEDIARQVATNVAGVLAPAERTRLARRPTQNAEAYDHFLRGNFFLAQRAARAAARAIEEYGAAIRLDPAFSAPLARSSLTYSLTLDWGWPHPGVPDDTIVARASAAASSALRLDSLSADAWMAEAFAKSHSHARTYEGVIEAMERAVALDSQNAEAWHQYGWFLYVLGRHAEALGAFQRALGIEPGRAITCEHIARVLGTQRRYAEARPWIDSAIALDPAQSFYYRQRSSLRLAIGDTTGARRDAEATAGLGADVPFWGVAALARITLVPGDTAAAREIEARLLATIPDPRHLSLPASFIIASVLAAAGARDAAISYLERAEPGPALAVALADRDFDSLRSEARFQRVVEQSRPPR
jgi:TolB-like protein/Tfp pilus assembly protein PilF